MFSLRIPTKASRLTQLLLVMALGTAMISGGAWYQSSLAEESETARNTNAGESIPPADPINDQPTTTEQPDEINIQGTEAKAQTSVKTDASGQVEVKVNGQTIPVPQNGSTSRTIISDNGTAQVQINNRTSTTSDGQSSSEAQTRSRSSTETEFKFHSRSSSN